MKFDIFFSICQTEVDGVIPSEEVMFKNFFEQVKLADELGYGTAWVAETHLSCEIQKTNSHAVIPHFKGEIGLNTDILQLALEVFRQTKNIEVGSAIRNILCNGGPIAHAEAIRTFLNLRNLTNDDRKINIGFASGRFEFSNRPYGIVPRNELERICWPIVKGKILSEATEIFLRLLKGDTFSSEETDQMFIEKNDFRSHEEWKNAYSFAKKNNFPLLNDKIVLDKRYHFEQLGVIPKDVNLDKLNLVLGSHDMTLQEKANRYLPVSVFNLSITPPEVIEQTHERMKKIFNKQGGNWERNFMPRTALIYMDCDDNKTESEKSQSGKDMAKRAWENYWSAMEGTLDQKKVDQAVGNTLAGSPSDIVNQIKDKYHPQDRLMLWFDFNNHNNLQIKKSMTAFMKEVKPKLSNWGDH